ncbi:hypothetical protein Tco_1548862 [Tanacetum coccineum]
MEILSESTTNSSAVESNTLSWKPCQGGSSKLSLPDHRYKRRCCSLTPVESDSLPYAHAQTTKTYYWHQDSRIKKAQVHIKDKDFRFIYEIEVDLLNNHRNETWVRFIHFSLYRMLIGLNNLQVLIRLFDDPQQLKTRKLNPAKRNQFQKAKKKSNNKKTEKVQKNTRIPEETESLPKLDEFVDIESRKDDISADEDLRLEGKLAKKLKLKNKKSDEEDDVSRNTSKSHKKKKRTEDLDLERRLAKRLKVKKGKLGGDEDDLSMLLPGFSSGFDSLDEASDENIKKKVLKKKRKKKLEQKVD